MAGNSAETRSFLKDVFLSGVGVMDKRKLLWLLGWGQDRPGAWKELLDLWEEIGGERKALSKIDIWGQRVCLFHGDTADALRVIDCEK